MKQQTIWWKVTVWWSCCCDYLSLFTVILGWCWIFMVALNGGPQWMLSMVAPMSLGWDWWPSQLTQRSTGHRCLPLVAKFTLIRCPSWRPASEFCAFIDCVDRIPPWGADYDHVPWLATREKNHKLSEEQDQGDSSITGRLHWYNTAVFSEQKLPTADRRKDLILLFNNWILGSSMSFGDFLGQGINRSVPVVGTFPDT